MDEKLNWISVGELADSFAPEANALAPTQELSGRTIDLAFANGDVIAYQFLSGDRLAWRFKGGARDGQGGEERYLATCIRPNLYFVDFVKGSVEVGTSVSVVLDLDSNVATAVLGRLPDAETAHGGLLARALKQEELTVVAANFVCASVSERFDPAAPHHAPTADLVGLRIRHRYNPTEIYEHIYLNEKRYCWQCIQGSEQGLADVDRCHYYAIRPNLYLFVWREKVVPTLGVVLLDLDALRTTGKIFGYKDAAMTTLTNFPMGAYSTIVNRTQRGF